MPEDPTAQIVVRVFDGTRQPIAANREIAITLTDGNLTRVKDHFASKGPELTFKVNFFNNFGDIYTVIVTADGYRDAGCFVHVSKAEPKSANVMLLPKHATFRFPNSDLASLKQNQPKLFDLLVKGATDDEAATRYANLRKDHPDTLAAIMNITTAMAQIELEPGTVVLDYFKQLIWDDTMTKARFFAYADHALIDQVRRAADAGKFAEEKNPGAFHEGASLSYKQTQFEQGNIQLTFHEHAETPTIDGKVCVKVEPDIDYYKDLIAHGLGEVLPNHVTKGLTDPEKVYLLRWIAGQEAGSPEFDPPYVIA
jgi:hypothetical protein